MIESILLFGDGFGVPQVFEVCSEAPICGVVGAEVRPQYFDLLKNIAAAQSIPFLVQPRPSSPAYADFLARVNALVPDLIIVNSYSMLLRPEILSIPRYGAVNLHGALLPQYRGCNPMQWALLNNESETGVTMHYMDETFDTGDIIAQRRVPIYFGDTWLDLQSRISEATKLLLAEEMPRLIAGTSSRRPQEASRARYYARRYPKDGLIDWQRSVLYLYNLIRALVRPHPGAFYYAGAEKIVLDEYLTLPEVVALKYGPGGGQKLQSNAVKLSPLLPGKVSPPGIGSIDKDGQTSLGAPDALLSACRCREWLETADLRNDRVIFGVRRWDTDGFVGFCCLQDINPFRSTALLQVHVHMDEAAEHRHDCELDAVNLMLDFSFRELELRGIVSTLPASGAAAIRAYEELGFRRDGVLCRRGLFKEDVVAMEVLREDYRVRQADHSSTRQHV